MPKPVVEDIAPELRVVRALRGVPCVERVWLFGSRARGDNLRRSDIDIAVEATRADASGWDRVAQAVEEAPTLLPIDLVRFDQAPQRLKEKILEQGRLLHDGRAGRTP